MEKIYIELTKRKEYKQVLFKSLIATAVFSASNSSSKITKEMIKNLVDPLLNLNPGSPESSIKTNIIFTY